MVLQLQNVILAYGTIGVFLFKYGLLDWVFSLDFRSLLGYTYIKHKGAI
jgi:hypothetical protein